jgi:hypothetical protein
MGKELRMQAISLIRVMTGARWNFSLYYIDHGNRL